MPPKIAKRVKKPKPKPKIDYPPVPTKKWIPPDKRPKRPKPPPAYIKPEGISQKLKISSLKKVWNKFEILENWAILLGHHCQTSKKYTFKTNGYQGACNCAVACIYAYLYKTASYNRYMIDQILDIGDALYVKSITQPENLCLTEIPPEKVYNSLFIDNQKIAFSLETKNKVTDRLAMISDEYVKGAFKGALEKFFRSFAVGIFCIKGKCVAIWIQDNAYFMFDPTGHEENGELFKGIPGSGLGCSCGNIGWGFAVIYRCKTLDSLVDVIYMNVESSTQNMPFDIIGCVLQRIVKIKTQPPESFEEIVEARPPPAHEPLEELEENKPEDILKTAMQSYVLQERESIASKLTEISPEVGQTISASKRPSWIGEGPIDKVDSCRYQIPPVSLPKKVSYYTELVPLHVGILRGTTCQTDPRLSKYEGRQSMGNAVSALTMLRIYKAHDWVPRTVNTILKNGDLMYRDAMISIPRTQSLKLSNFQRKTEYEGKFFMPVIEDCCVVGKLQSRESDVVDLQPALENWLFDHDCCVITGPLTLAVWVENEKYFMFDPNERDQQGKAIRNDTLIPLEYVPGVACVIWCTNIKDLVDIYMNNVEKCNKMDTFYLNKIQIDDYVEIPETWYNFKGLEPGKWILRGTISQSDKQFKKESRHHQSPAINFVALATQLLKPLKDWGEETVDEIIISGDQHYNHTIDYLTEIGKFEEKPLVVEDILKKVRIDDKEAHFNIEFNYIEGVLNGKNDSALKKALQAFFVDNDMAVITCRNVSYAFWKKEDFFYYFDSHDRDDKGLAKNYGTGCVLRAQLIQDLSEIVETNLDPGIENKFAIHQIAIQFFNCTNIFCQPPVKHYNLIRPGQAILRSIYSEISNRFGISAGKQTVPMCLTALSFNKLKASIDWCKSDVDEILIKGNGLYEDTMEEILKNKEDEEEVEDEEDSEKDRITSENCKNEFFIGVNKFNVEYEDISEGNIKENLRNALKEYFSKKPVDEHDHQELLLETKSAYVCMWRDDDLFFVFDSRPRDKKGLAMNIIQWMNEDGTQPDLRILHTKRKQEEAAAKRAARTAEAAIAETEAALEEGMGDEMDREGGGDFVEGRQANYDDYLGYISAGAGEEGVEESEDELERYFPLIVKTSSFWREKEKAGKACTLWFAYLNDMIDHVFNNIPGWSRKTDDYKLRAVKITNTISLKDKLWSPENRIDVYSGDWYYLKELEHGKWILRGTMTLLSDLFPESNRGKQIVPTCYVALAIAKVFKMVCFNDATVDSILSYGDRLYTYVKKMRKKQILKSNKQNLAEDEVDWLLEHEEFELEDVPKKICISKFMVDVSVETNVVVGDVKAQNFEEVLDVKRGIDEFFKENSYGIMQAKGLTVAIWKGKKMFYMFDGFPRGPNGIVSPYGTACVLRYLDVEKLSKDFLQNLPNHGKNNFAIHKVTMTKDLCPRMGQPKVLTEPIVTVKSGGFKEVIPGKHVIRGTISQEDPKFGKSSGELGAPIAIIALSMTLVHKPTLWTKPLIDDIIELGFDYYEQTINTLQYEYDIWEDEMDIYKLNRDYKIGFMQANCEIRLTTQCGIIDTKNEHYANLRQGIERFFEENTHGVVITESLTVAIWEGESVQILSKTDSSPAEPMIYIFDPNPRSSTGMPLFTGTACMVGFLNATMAADHIISCILQPELRNKEFKIVPVEIIVGNYCTCKCRKKKLKKAQTKSEVRVLPRCTKSAQLMEKRMLRKIGDRERRIKEIKRIQTIGRKAYFPMKGNVAILRGYLSQNSECYSANSRNNQDIPNCIVSIVMNHICKIENWNCRHIDMILNTGDQLYIDSYIAYSPKDMKLGLENVLRHFFMNKMLIHVTVYKSIISDYFVLPNLDRVLNVFFQQETICMLSYNDQWVTLIFQSGQFYVFDPHERNIEGKPLCDSSENGTAVVLRFNDIETMMIRLLLNLTDEERNMETNQEGEAQDPKKFSLWLISVEIKSY